MRSTIENITILQKKINDLQIENNLLKQILVDANIDYTTKLRLVSNVVNDSNTNQEIQIKDINADVRTANLFFSMFWGRQDVYAKRYYNKKTGKSGYYPQCINFWKNGCNKIKGGTCRDCLRKSYKPLKAQDIIAHLKGNSEDCRDVIGIYPLFSNSTTRVLVFDFDNHDECNGEEWKEEVTSLIQICKFNGIDPLIERSRSGDGAHVWIFFNKPIDASVVRKFAFLLLEKGEEQISIKSYKYYDRMLPNQDYIDDQGLGNLIALPLQGQAVQKGNSVFVDENWHVYSDQIAILLSKPKLSKEFIEEKIIEWSKSNCFSFTDDKEKTKPWRQIDFQKSDISGKLSIFLSNGIYIDTTNIAPILQNSIRRLAAFSNPIFYKNKSIGISNYQTSRIIYLGRDHYNGYIEIPRGLLEQLIDLCKKSSIEYEVLDEEIKALVLM